MSKIKRGALEITVWAFVAVGLVLLLAGCGSPTVYRDRVVSVNVPVPTPCAGERPAKVETLRERFPAWADMDVRQKAAAVGVQAGDLRGYGEQLDAATAACP